MGASWHLLSTSSEGSGIYDVHAAAVSKKGISPILHKLRLEVVK